MAVLVAEVAAWRGATAMMVPSAGQLQGVAWAMTVLAAAEVAA
jgi:hypothetical protein